MSEIYGDSAPIEPQPIEPPPEPAVEAEGLQGGDGGYEAPAVSDSAYGWYGDGPQQGVVELSDDPGGLYAEGPQQGVAEQFVQPGEFYSDDPFGDRGPFG